MFRFLRYYSRKDIQKAIVEQLKDKELGVRYRETFGKRPDTLQFETDVLEFARKGATSFHVSEETWNDPMNLLTGTTRKQLDDQRKGWDLILDIDCPYWDYSKLTAYLLVEALKFHNVKSVSTKFSGNKGLHIGIPFEAFPDEVNGTKTKNLYPEGLRVIAAYLQNMIKPMLAQKILEKESIREIMRKTGKTEAELVHDGQFDPFTVIDIDTVLISSRHLYRSAYSLHEKTQLVSLPIEPSRILAFSKEEAEPEKASTKLKFLDRTSVKERDARELIIQAFDWHSKQTINRKIAEDNREPTTKMREHEVMTTAISEDKFPPCIRKLLDGKMEDGKKRGLFILLRFLRNVGWSAESTDKKIKEWNQTNTTPLSESYMASQLTWHKRQKEMILPPNCANNSYYKDLQICPENCACKRYKNPVNYTKSQYKIDTIKGKVKKLSSSDSQASREASAPRQQEKHQP